MANFLSKPPSTATDGERMFYNRIATFFEPQSHVIAYFEPYIGDLHPDFVILSPQHGILIVEVKDYSERYLKSTPKTGKWERLEDEKPVFLENPFDQLYQYWRAIKDRIGYCHFPDDVYIPITRLVAFSQISESSYAAGGIRALVPNKIYVCFKETLRRNENFEEFLVSIIPVNANISEEQFKVLRANIIPTCRLPDLKQTDLLEYYSIKDRIKLLDNEQESLARKMGEGHRLIFGVAGSGKTVLLIARARILAKRYPNWRILILCYNKRLKMLLFHLLNPQDYDADITINNYHAWARDYILSADNEFSKLYLEAEEKARHENQFDEFFNKFVPRILTDMLTALGDEKITYDAILIDEAQDFEEDWFKSIMQVLNSGSNSLLITCDGLQGIYARKRFTWSSVGIQARGRVRRFQKSYRTPIEIGFIAQETLPQAIKELIGKFDEFLATKEFIGTHGILEFILSRTREEEYRKLADKINNLLKSPQEILVLFKYNMAKRNYEHLFFDFLRRLHINWKDLMEYDYKTPGLLIGTLHGTKGLEADTIIIPEVNTYRSDQDRQLLYVGMTRTKKKLILSANKSTEFVKTLQEFQTSDLI
jgi:superfamily I DNA and RNA helicase